jgi:predicted DNA-binding transcriptional regulator AlpA
MRDNERMHSALDDDAPTLLRTEDAARRLGLSARTLDLWRHRGTGPRWVRLTARVIHYPADALEEWIASQRTEVAGGRRRCERNSTK